MDRIRITIVVRVIRNITAVSTGPEDDIAFAAAAEFCGIFECGDGERTWSFDSGARIIGTPAVGLDLDQLREIIHCFGLLGIRCRGGDQPHAHQSGIWCGAGDANSIVALGSNVAGTGRAMVITGSRVGIGIIAIPILVIGSIHIGREVGVGGLQPIIHHADADACTATACGRGIIPDGLDIDIGARRGSRSFLQVPLAGDQRIIRQSAQLALRGQQHIGGCHLAHGAQVDHGIQCGEWAVGTHDDPAGRIFRVALDDEIMGCGDFLRSSSAHLHTEIRRDDAARPIGALFTNQVGHRENRSLLTDGAHASRQCFHRRGRIERENPILAIHLAQHHFIQREADRQRLPCGGEIPGLIGIDHGHPIPLLCAGFFFHARTGFGCEVRVGGGVHTRGIAPGFFTGIRLHPHDKRDGQKQRTEENNGETADFWGTHEQGLLETTGDKCNPGRLTKR